jgi:hypothetical protein
VRQERGEKAEINKWVRDMESQEISRLETGVGVLPPSSPASSGEPKSFAELVRPATSRNIPVIPIPFMEKGPKYVNWQNVATCDPKQIAAWDEQFPGNMNYGCVAKLGGFWFLDDDCGTLKERYESETGRKFPQTFTVKTRKGFHYYWKHTDLSESWLNNRKVPDLFDAQAEDKQVVGPGSTHPSGVKYEIFDDARIVKCPDDLVNWICDLHIAYKKSKGLDTPRRAKAEAEGQCELWMLEEMCDTLEIGYTGFSDYELDIECPWEDEHSEAHDRDTTIAIIKGQPTFSCLHAHCEGRHWKEFRDQVDPDRQYKFPLGDEFDPDDERLFDVEDDDAEQPLSERSESAEQAQSSRTVPANEFQDKVKATGDTGERYCYRTYGCGCGMIHPEPAPPEEREQSEPETEEAERPEPEGEEQDAEYQTLASGKNKGGAVMSLEVQWASTVDTEPLQWLWPDRLPKGKMNLFAGRPDCCKTLCLCDLIARVTTGSDWPDGSKNIWGAQKVILASSEDDPRDTLVPRLQAAGAELDKVGLVRVGRLAKEGGKKRRMLKLKDDYGLIKRTLEQNPDVALICLDPISSFFGDADANKDKEIKPVLDGLANALRNTGATFIAISHLNKRPDGDAGQRILGASSILGSARAVWFFNRDPENANEFFMTLVKGNLAKKRTGMKYSVAERNITLKDGSESALPYIEWQGEHEETADELLLRQKEVGRGGVADKKITKATLFLQKKFAQASTFKCSNLYKEAQDEGVGVDTLKRARRDLETAGETIIRVEDRRSEGKGFWWTLQPRDDSKMTLNDEDRM